MIKIGVLGTGGWGTALSVLCQNKGLRVQLWGHTPTRVEQLRSSRINIDYLPGVTLPNGLSLTSDLADCADADVIVFATPSTALRQIAVSLQPLVKHERTVLLSCSK